VYSKRFIVLLCLALVSGLLVGLLPFRDEFEVSAPKFYAEVNIVHAYFQVLNVSRDSGVFSERMVSYVIVLNITNPTEKIFEIRELWMWFGNREEAPFHTVSFTNLVVSYYNDFESGHSIYYWHPSESRLVAFSMTEAIDDGGLELLKSHEGDFELHLCTAGLGEQTTSAYESSTISQKLQLKTLNDNEFVYGDYFNADRQFGFDSRSLDIMGSAVR
jgi:hypothetical protein